MALYALADDEAIPVAPWSVQEPDSMVEDVASPRAEFCEPNVDTE